MSRYVRYLKYVLVHKWYVFLECAKVGLFWRGLVHDISKLLPDELIPYARYFYDEQGNDRNPRDETGYYKPYDTGDAAFDYAWLLHQKRNRHHWQYWVLPKDDGGIIAMEMPPVYRLEMICDWRGAGKAQGYGDNTAAWYLKNKGNMILGAKTREFVECYIGVKEGAE